MNSMIDYWLLKVEGAESVRQRKAPVNLKFNIFCSGRDNMDIPQSLESCDILSEERRSVKIKK